MSGNVGIADATNPVTFGNYKIYAVDGSGTERWVKLQIKDSNDNLVKTMIISTDEGEKDTGLGFKIKPLKIYTSTITNTVTAKLLVGTELEKTINNGDEFSGNWKWSLKIDAPGYINASNYIGVKYNPDSQSDDDNYVKIGGKLVAPNGYFEVGYPKNVVDQFTKLEISLVESTKVYPDITSTTGFDAKGGLLISADSPVFGGETYSKVLIYWNDTASQLVYAYYDDAAKKYIEQSIPTSISIDGKYDNTKFKIQLDNTTAPTKLTLSITGGSADAIDAGYYFDNTTGSSTLNQFTKLGATKGQAEATELNVTYGGKTYSKGDVDYDITTPYGLVVVNPKTNGKDDKVVVKIPAEQQKAYVYVGKLKGETTAGGTYHDVVKLSLPVARLASEVKPLIDQNKLDANLVLVGGPCANSIVQALVEAGNLDKSFTCAGGTPGSAWTPETAYIKVIENAFASGKIALVVAGTNPADTRLATTLLAQQVDKIKSIDKDIAVIKGNVNTWTVE
jgi:hypothetical protein